VAVRSRVVGSVVGVASGVALVGKFMVGSPAGKAHIKGVMRAIADPSKGGSTTLPADQAKFFQAVPEIGHIPGYFSSNLGGTRVSPIGFSEQASPLGPGAPYFEVSDSASFFSNMFPDRWVPRVCELSTTLNYL
jgi:hypothetical protein